MGGAADVDDFLATGRTGRRNAMSDIHDEKCATVATGDLPSELSKMSCSGQSFSEFGNCRCC